MSATTSSRTVLLSEQIRMAVQGSAASTLTAEPSLPVTATTPASILKRAIDLFGALVGLVLAGPLMIVCAIAVKLTSPGPIFFKQLRLGHGGRPFYVLKFRTMVIDAERRLAELESQNEAGGVLFKIRRDPRITPIGGILRRTSLDELPQLINVLRGEMSLVGPRPLQLRDSHLLEASDPEAFATRLSVIPGVTGAWQIGGRSDGTEGMVRQDLEYVENWSLLLDLKILLMTIPAVLSCRGAC